MPWDLDPPRSSTSRASQPLWWFDEAEVADEVEKFPWLCDPTSCGAERLCNVCRYLDITHLFGPPYDFKTKSVFSTYIDGTEYVFGELRLGRLDDLKRKAETCPLCRCLHTLFTTSYPGNWSWKDRKEWYNSPSGVGNLITGGRSLAEAHDIWYGLLETTTKINWSESYQGNQGTGHRRLTLHLHSRVSYEKVSSGYRCIEHTQHVTPQWTYLQVVDAGKPSHIVAGLSPVGPGINYESIKELLTQCGHTHPGHTEQSCPAAIPPALRKPHVTNFVDVQKHCLVTGDVLSTSYATLSYVWGDAQPLELDVDGWKALWEPGGLERVYSTLHPAILDSIRVCRGLGIQYVWSDAVCIVQNSPDKMQQIRNMHFIYTNCDITLVAGAGPNDGLAGVRNQTRNESQISSQVAPGITLGVQFEHRQKDYGTFAWDRRGWTLQESMLSSKVLYFSKTTWRYDCQHGSTFEYEARNVHDDSKVKCEHASVHGSTIHSSSEADVWIYRTAVVEYTARILSVSSDVVNAFTGLMAAMAEHFRTKVFVSCLPVGALDQALLWRRRGHSQLIRRMEPALPRWSWAGWEGAMMPYPDVKLIRQFKLLPHNPELSAACRGTHFTDDVVACDMSAAGWDRESSLPTPHRCPDNYRHRHAGVCQHDRDFQSFLISELHILTDVAEFLVRWDDQPETVWEKNVQQIRTIDGTYVGNVCFDDLEGARKLPNNITLRFAKIACRRFAWSKHRPAADVLKVGKRLVPMSDEVGWREIAEPSSSGPSTTMGDLVWQCPLYVVLAIDERDQRLGLAEILVEVFDDISLKAVVVRLK